MKGFEKFWKPHPKIGFGFDFMNQFIKSITRFGLLLSYFETVFHVVIPSSFIIGIRRKYSLFVSKSTYKVCIFKNFNDFLMESFLEE